MRWNRDSALLFFVSFRSSSRHTPLRDLACPAHTKLEVSLRSVGSLSVRAPGVRIRCHPEPTLDCGFAFATVQHDLASASLRLRISSGLVCWLTPVWGWTHGHDPGVPLWAGVAMVALGLWFPVFVFLSLLASFRFFRGGNVKQLYDKYHPQSASTTHGDEGSTYTL